MLAWPPRCAALICLNGLALETLPPRQLASQLPSLFRRPTFTFGKERDKANHGDRNDQTEPVTGPAALRESDCAGQFRSSGFRCGSRSARGIPRISCAAAYRTYTAAARV